MVDPLYPVLAAILDLPPAQAAQSLASHPLTFLWVLVRLLPLGALVPWLSLAGAAPLARSVVLLVLALVLTPIANLASAAHAMFWPWQLGRELLVGAAFALAVASPLWAAAWVGELSDLWRNAGTNGSAALTDAGSSSALGTLYLWSGCALFFAVGGHRSVLDSLGELLVQVPVGGPWPGLDALGHALVRACADAFGWAVLGSMAVALCVLALDLTTAVAARTAGSLASTLATPSTGGLLGLAVALASMSLVLDQLPRLVQTAIAHALAMF